MKGIRLIVFLLALSLAAASAGSDDIFGQLAGTWKGGGEVRGMPSEQSMVWAPALDGRFTRLQFSNRMTTPDGGEFHFQAHAYYRVMPDGAVSGHWFDSRGVSFPLNGSQAPACLSIEWGTADTELGRTGYCILEGRLDVTDEVMDAGGEWRVFGRSTLKRP